MSLRAISRPSADPYQPGISLLRPLSFRIKSSKIQKIKVSSDTSNSGDRRQSSGGDQFVADLPVQCQRQKFRARRSLSVTQTSVKGDQIGESGSHLAGVLYNVCFASFQHSKFLLPINQPT